jgi:FKBP-type peptidyl-prolyl cis-trans isomerase SlyD
MPIQISQPPGDPLEVVVTDFTEEAVTLDGNHPLAGQTLNFEVSVASLREATSDELAAETVDAPPV